MIVSTARTSSTVPAGGTTVLGYFLVLYSRTHNSLLNNKPTSIYSYNTRYRTSSPKKNNFWSRGDAFARGRSRGHYFLEVLTTLILHEHQKIKDALPGIIHY